MKTLLTGLLLVVASAQATPVIDISYGGVQIDFKAVLHPVTTEDTPEWAKLPNARAWWEIKYGIEINDTRGMLMVFRGVLLMDPGWRVVRWMEIVPIQGPVGSNDDPNGTPEPGTFMLMAFGGALLAFFRRRRARDVTPRG